MVVLSFMVYTYRKAFYRYAIICYILQVCSWFTGRRKTEKEEKNGHSGCVSWEEGGDAIARGSFKYLSPTEIIHMFFNSLHTKQLKWFNVTAGTDENMHD